MKPGQIQILGSPPSIVTGVRDGPYRCGSSMPGRRLVRVRAGKDDDLEAESASAIGDFDPLNLIRESDADAEVGEGSESEKTGAGSGDSKQASDAVDEVSEDSSHEDSVSKGSKD